MKDFLPNGRLGLNRTMEEDTALSWQAGAGG